MKLMKRDIKMKIKSLKIKTHKNVYTPREDSLLLADVIWEFNDIGKVLDMGTGSGIQAIIISKKAEKVLGVDINPDAIKLAKENARINKAKNISFIVSDLFDKVNGKFDLILFNAPYLPVEDKIKGAEQWSGGKTGREILERFAVNVKKYLKKDGIILIVISSLTGLKETKKLFNKYGFEVGVIRKKKVPWEVLYVLEINIKN